MRSLFQQVRSIRNTVYREAALELMNQVPRWRHKDKPSDPEQYVQRALETNSNIKIVCILEQILVASFFKGAAFIGTTEGYDKEKTQAMIEYGSGDPSILEDNPIWINYQSWEDVPPTLTAFPQKALPEVWNTFTEACREAFPEARQVIARSRFHDVWTYVYTEPWELICEVDLTGKKYNKEGFRWQEPKEDGKIFQGYDDRFSRYGILRLQL